MDNERKSWEQMLDKGEPDLWYGRFVKYMRLGTKRSVNAVAQKETKKSQEKTRTNAGPEWYDAEKEWKWKERARAYDEWIRAEEDRVIAEEKDKVLKSGYALMHKRVKTLDRLSRKLEMMEKDDSKLWIPETKTTVMGENKSVTVEKVVFNHHLYLLIDKLFDSIAKEVGDRVKKQEIDVTNNDNEQDKVLHDKVMEVLDGYPEIKWKIAEVMDELDKST